LHFVRVVKITDILEKLAAFGFKVRITIGIFYPYVILTQTKRKDVH
jgi:hypothetical protein